MKKTLALLTILSAASMTGCASTGDVKSSGNSAFDEAIATANQKNAEAMKIGYAWTSAAIKNKYGSDKTPDGKAYKESGKKLSLVDVAIFEGEQALKKGDEDTAMKKATLANELADAQMAQAEQGKHSQILWK